MSRDDARPLAPGLHIRQLHLVTDHEPAQRLALGQRLAGELDAALAQAVPGRRVDIGELVVEASAAQLDARGLPRLAAAVARRILEQVHD